MMLYKRQKLLLDLVHAAGGELAATDMYRREDLPAMRPAIRNLGELLEDHERIALTSFEKEHTCCHRHCVADEMKKRIKGCPEPEHI